MTEEERSEFAEARATFEAELEELRSGHPNRWSDSERVELFFLVCRARYYAGDNGAILQVINSASIHQVAVPTWAMEAFSTIYDTVLGPQAVNRRWDQAFGKPVPKGRHLSSVRNEQKSFEIFALIETLREKEVTVDEAMFESVGNHFGIDKTTCSDLYYEERKIWESNQEFLATQPTSANS